MHTKEFYVFKVSDNNTPNNCLISIEIAVNQPHDGGKKCLRESLGTYLTALAFFLCIIRRVVDRKCNFLPVDELQESECAAPYSFKELAHGLVESYIFSYRGLKWANYT